MPIRVQNDLPVKEILEKENIFVMDENRAVHQDIRPIKIGLLNLMPLKEDTELQLLRSLSNTPLQVDIVFLAVKNHVSKNTSANHLNRFYENFENVKDQKFDGFIITGAPVEQMPFEEVDYWEELANIYNNAAKYAMEGTRIYADLQTLDGKVIFSLKNISEQPLNISSADELTERFIRGDLSRSTEGSGLGLSIAKTLTTMMGGTFDLYLDGDLFKVVIIFNKVS